MNEIIFIDDKIFKQFKNTNYYCSCDGDIYSNYSRKLLKPLSRKFGTKDYLYIDINFGSKQKHYPIHKIVYETWVGNIPEGYFILHKDDNSLNNNINNLYAGTQKENIRDCIDNNHRVGALWILTVFDKKENKTITFCPASDFIAYSEHTCQNKGVNRMFSRNWFKKRYEIISYNRCKNLQEKEGVTTMKDECTSVELRLALLEARNILK